MKLITKIVGATLGLAMALGVGVGVANNNNKVVKEVSAADAAIVFGNQGWSNSSKHNDFTLSNFRFVKSGSGTDATYYTSDSTLRYYNNTTLTITTL